MRLPRCRPVDRSSGETIKGRPEGSYVTWKVILKPAFIVMMDAGFVLRGAEFISWKNQAAFHEMNRFPLLHECF